MALGFPSPTPAELGLSVCKLCRDFLVVTFAPVPIYMQNQLLHLVFSEVQGVGRILSEAMSCLDKLDSPWQLSTGWSRWVEAESKIGWLVSRERREGGLFARWIIIFNLKLNN